MHEEGGCLHEPYRDWCCGCGCGYRYHCHRYEKAEQVIKTGKGRSDLQKMNMANKPGERFYRCNRARFCFAFGSGESFGGDGGQQEAHACSEEVGLVFCLNG